MTTNPIFGQIKFDQDTVVIPETGTNILKPRFEFTTKPGSGENWIVEVEIVDALPWYRGDTKDVKVRFMSKKFESELRNTSNSVYVFKGPMQVGIFKRCNQLAC